MPMQEEVYSETSRPVIDVINSILNNYRRDLHNNQCDSLCNYLKKNNSDEQLLSIIKKMNTCNCCNRHQIDKPHSLEEYRDYKYPTQDKDYQCKCNCRQIARNCCRAKFGFKQCWIVGANS